jgi:hypothetical protein
MIPTIYRRNDAPSTPAPVFDPALVLIDPLTSPVPPTWRMTEDPEWTALVAELGDPTTVDASVDETPPAGDDAPVEVAVEVEIEIPPTVALDRDLVEWCSACDADAGDPCRTPSGAVKIGVHPIRVAA